MSRSYRGITTGKHLVYMASDLMTIFGVSRNTITNWKNEGLRASDTQTPSIFNGSAVKQFHDERRLTSTVNLRPGQFKCFSCKERVFPLPLTVECYRTKRGRSVVSAMCPSCTGRLSKTVNQEVWMAIEDCTSTNTSLCSIDEGTDQLQAGIVHKVPSEAAGWLMANDRVLYDWIQYAGRYDKKTVSAHLAAIRDFEIFIEGKPFQKVSARDVAAYRDYLKARLSPASEARLSVSTVRHRMSHLKAFCNWLMIQKGFTGLDKSIPASCDLPKKFDAAHLDADTAPIPTIAEACQMAKALPAETFIQRRDRAMFCIAFLGALRADTVTSLLVTHLNVQERIIVQNGQQSRTKNGKSLKIKFFPVPEVFAQIVSEWLKELVEKGFQPGDALFPANDDLASRFRLASSPAIPPMKSTHAVSKVFKDASAAIGLKFSPHAAKHCIGQLVWAKCRSPEAFQAWSQMMGHENIEITQRYYSKIPESRAFELFENFDEGSDNTSDDLNLMLRYHEHDLVKGSPEFERAQALVSQRLAKSK